MFLSISVFSLTYQEAVYHQVDFQTRIHSQHQLFYTEYQTWSES